MYRTKGLVNGLGPVCLGTRFTEGVMHRSVRRSQEPTCVVIHSLQNKALSGLRWTGPDSHAR